LAYRFGDWLIWADERWRVHRPVALLTILFVVSPFLLSSVIPSPVILHSLGFDPRDCFFGQADGFLNLHTLSWRERRKRGLAICDSAP